MTTRTRLLTLILLCAAGTAAALPLALRVYRRHHPLPPTSPPPENPGDYAGPLTRPAPPYNASKPPSRPWLDPKRSAPPPTTYHAYAASSINNQQTDYLLYLPPDFADPANAARRYPVIYWLHGYGSYPEDGLPFVETLDAAIRAGQCPPIIAVLPNGLHDSWFVNSADGTQPVENVIINDLIPHIDNTYRTIPDRTGRAIEGFSMGGWGAAHLAFKYPDRFCAVTMISALLYTHDHFPQRQRIFNDSAPAYYAEDPVTRAHRDATKFAGVLKIRLLAGANDIHYRGLDFARNFDKRLTQWNIPHELTIVPGVDHNDGDLYQHLGARAFTFYKEIFLTSNPD
ncbi:MAG: putative esterase [Phycisphaerales bacterium]|nr:putative esterase [Phycisphaerales bacterium]